MDNSVQKELAAKAKGRQQFKHGDRVIYEWDQNIDECNIYVELPPILIPENRKAF